MTLQKHSKYTENLEKKIKHTLIENIHTQYTNSSPSNIEGYYATKILFQA